MSPTESYHDFKHYPCSQANSTRWLAHSAALIGIDHDRPVTDFQIQVRRLVDQYQGLHGFQLDVTVQKGFFRQALGFRGRILDRSARLAADPIQQFSNAAAVW